MIYFIRDRGTGMVKIGYSGDPQDRVKSLETGSPKGVELLAACRGDLWHERMAQALFDHLREKGEWFRPAEELMAFVAAAARNVGLLEAAPRKPWHAYQTGPIDVWDGWLSADEWIVRNASGCTFHIPDRTPKEEQLDYDERRFMLLWAASQLRQRTGWEGDGDWWVSCLPRPDYCDSVPIFAVKQANNGSCFFICEEEVSTLGRGDER
jgi:hypothetical protein